jgi:hypothetical protein
MCIATSWPFILSTAEVVAFSFTTPHETYGNDETWLQSPFIDFSG